MSFYNNSGVAQTSNFTSDSSSTLHSSGASNVAPGTLRVTDSVVDMSAAYADLSAATAITINALREAFQVQRLLERDARGGTRYIELILSHFGVRSPDARLQRPEFLGGGTTRVGVYPVASTATSSASGTPPQGHLAAFGTALGDAAFSHSFVEHGVVIGFASVRADYTYQQGVERFGLVRLDMIFSGQLLLISESKLC